MVRWDDVHQLITFGCTTLWWLERDWKMFQYLWNWCWLEHLDIFGWCFHRFGILHIVPTSSDELIFFRGDQSTNQEGWSSKENHSGDVTWYNENGRTTVRFRKTTQVISPWSRERERETERASIGRNEIYVKPTVLNKCNTGWWFRTFFVFPDSICWE